MTVKKLLFIPSQRLLWHTSTALKSWLLGHELPHHAEIQYAGDLPTVLGHDNVFVLGRYYPHIFSSTIPDQCSYPSCHGAPRPSFISKRQLNRTLSQIDAVLISSLAGQDTIKEIIALARSRDIPIAILDLPDYDTLYGAKDLSKRLTLGYQLGRDFDLYFKKDLPIGHRTEHILPFSPIPIRPESYSFTNLPKKHSIFYSGRKREDQSSPERAQVVHLVEKEIAKANIVTHDARNTFSSARQYWDNLASAYIALSPSGRCWDSFRHCEVGLAPATAIMVPQPFIETAGPGLIDAKNCLLYDVTLQSGRYYLTNPPEVISKLKYYLRHLDQLASIADQWKKDVLSGHTILSRSHYIIESMQSVF